MGRGKSLNKDKDPFIKDLVKKRKTDNDYKLFDNNLQDYIAEILQKIRYRKSGNGYMKAIYGGSYNEELKKTCIKILNLIDREQARKKKESV